jgi:hypothetical protein
LKLTIARKALGRLLRVRRRDDVNKVASIASLSQWPFPTARSTNHRLTDEIRARREDAPENTIRKFWGAATEIAPAARFRI